MGLLSNDMGEPLGDAGGACLGQCVVTTMHKSKPSKHKPVLIKKRNPVVAALLRNPKRNAGKHKNEAVQKLTMLDTSDKEQ